jgi:hypothetical protein
MGKLLHRPALLSGVKVTKPCLSLTLLREIGASRSLGLQGRLYTSAEKIAVLHCPSSPR